MLVYVSGAKLVLEGAGVGVHIFFTEIAQTEKTTMTKLRIFGLAAALSVIATAPVVAQQAAQEPGEQSFYQSLGVGSHEGGATNAMASVGAAAPSTNSTVKHSTRTSSKHNANAHKL